MLVSTIQNKRYYLKKKKNELENNLRVPPQNSPALQDRPHHLLKHNKILLLQKRDKVNSLNETIENKDKEITQLKRQKTFAHVVFFVTSKTVVLSLDSRCKRGSARQVVADYIKELEKKVQELQEQVNEGREEDYSFRRGGKG
ncbi:hypothetical protein RIR_jg11005.t1 [Rhizophagus irregularis DAOM 181602=DAOM 197198]|nr:hypothetical protein RIR_jg11005.t1 [Rhizophagus irregularis DAOM 181602=DAOM 197198]